jgi:hypothetical protein
MSTLIYPGSLEFAMALREIPPVPTWRAHADKTNGDTYLICRSGSLGLMEAVSRKEWLEYVNDGELDQRQDEIEAHEAELNLLIN